ncbi:MAG: DNA polymerase III subunit gamma/tau [Candidatus Falkowbacteria bacterium]
MSTLYRDYRPSNFSQVFGQNHVKITLQNEIANNKLAHAYLFCGPRAVGKTTLARVLAKAVNCTNRTETDSEPCNSCASCLSISAGSNLDIIEIDAASNTGVDNVRENIIASARIVSSSVKYRVFIIDEVHMLSISAWNALLKTLEEPPKNVIFILCTTEIHKVPATIISRCERYDFKRISVSDIVSKLQNIISQEKVEVETEVLEAIARQSGGHLRDAESLLGQVLSLGEGKITWDQAELIVPRHHHNEIIDLLEFISKKDVSRSIKLINTIVDSGLNLKNFVGEGIVVLRKILLSKANSGLAESLGLDLGDTLEIRISALASELKIEQIILYLESFLAVYNNLNSSFIVQLPLEMKIVELCLEAPFVSMSLPDSVSNASSPKPVSSSLPKKSVAAKTPDLKTNTSVINFSQSEAAAKWPEFLARLRQQNHSLSFILQNCQVGAILSNKLSLIFKYKFHRDRINDASIRPLVESTLAEVYGGSVNLDLLIDENLELAAVAAISESVAPVSAPADKISDIKNEEPNNLLNNLLQTFGGEVIS